MKLVFFTPEFYEEKKIWGEMLSKHEQYIKREMCKYIEEYKRTKNLTEIPAYATLVRYSTLQYFEEFFYHF